MRRTSFRHYIGIDYSGAKAPDDSLPGLRVFRSTPNTKPTEIRPHENPRRGWTRREVQDWLIAQLGRDEPGLVGIDHSFSFPRQYFEIHSLGPYWPDFLDDFRRHWPTDEPGVRVECVRQGRVGNGAARSGNARWRRLTDVKARAKSVFHFDVPGSVAKSTHAGLPWLCRLRDQLGQRVHFWPFDGWHIASSKSVIAEAYPALLRDFAPPENLTPDQRDAYQIAAWLRHADQTGELDRYFNPGLSKGERDIAAVEGWILGLL